MAKQDLTLGFLFYDKCKNRELFGIAATGAYGAAFDTTGQIATYDYYGEGGTAGTPGIFGGVQIAGSNAQTTQDMQGPFNAYNASVADGPGGGLDYFSGKSLDGCKDVKGGGFALGGGVGANAFVGQTTTGLGNVGHQW